MEWHFLYSILSAGGLVLVGVLIWYYAVDSNRAATATVTPARVQFAQVEVQGGFAPDKILVDAGRPVQIRFLRLEDRECSQEVVFRDFGIREPLPSFDRSSVVVIPFQPGEYEFTCGKGKLKGKLIARDPKEQAGTSGSR
ncbi:MAG TPA: cupredoxin domain-containing protein [bacterium]|nr:cupredoxin domain-containing protein [bacterium]